MKNRIKDLVQEIESIVAKNNDELEAMRIKYLSKKGLVSELFNDFRNVANEEKREVGQLLNELKNKAQDKINEIKESFESLQTDDNKTDLTRSADPLKVGTRHPLSLTKNEIIDIFSRIGFTIAEGPEIEDDWHVFGALNFPPEHPARDMQDTFFIEQNPDVLLRTHTSSVQSRIMAYQKPPIRMLFPGRVFRNEAI
jgi:phenylalanyl-tRNA synthetase alpha chain